MFSFHTPTFVSFSFRWEAHVLAANHLVLIGGRPSCNAARRVQSAIYFHSFEQHGYSTLAGAIASLLSLPHSTLHNHPC